VCFLDVIILGDSGRFSSALGQQRGLYSGGFKGKIQHFVLVVRSYHK
jgi:hypothetical protein